MRSAPAFLLQLLTYNIVTVFMNFGKFCTFNRMYRQDVPDIQLKQTRYQLLLTNTYKALQTTNLCVSGSTLYIEIGLCNTPLLLSFNIKNRWQNATLYMYNG